MAELKIPAKEQIMKTTTYRLRGSLLCCLLLLAGSTALQAQTDTTGQLSLRECVEIAHKNNLELKQAELQAAATNIDYRQAKSNLLPNVNGNIEHGLNQGRSIDPFSNSYLNQNINYANYGVSGGVSLFNGLSAMNAVKQTRLGAAAGQMDVQQNRDMLTLNVITAYLQVLLATDLLTQVQNQADLSQKQVERLTILNDEGAVPPSQLFDLKGQLAGDQVTLVNTKNQLEAAKLTLAQFMNLPYNTNIKLQRITSDELLAKYAATPDSIYQVALKQLPLVKSAQLKKESAAFGLKSTRGLYWPSVSLNAGLYTNYSSAANTSTLLSTTDQQTDQYVLIGGVKEPVYVPVNQYNDAKIPYGNQFRNNYSTNVNLFVRVPILNYFNTRNRVAKAKLDVENANLVENNAKIKMQQQVEQAYLNMTATYNRFNVLLQQSDAFNESFRITEARFTEGVVNSVDYLTAKNNLDRANISLITAKYEYVLRTKILNYYQNQPLW